MAKILRPRFPHRRERVEISKPLGAREGDHYLAVRITDDALVIRPGAIAIVKLGESYSSGLHAVRTPDYPLLVRLITLTPRNRIRLDSSNAEYPSLEYPRRKVTILGCVCEVLLNDTGVERLVYWRNPALLRSNIYERPVLAINA